jgi:hypothetical protein
MDEAIAFLLLEDLVIKPLFSPSVTRIRLASFRSYFKRLLRLYALRLCREAENKLKNEFASLVSAI